MTSAAPVASYLSVDYIDSRISSLRRRCSIDSEDAKSITRSIRDDISIYSAHECDCTPDMVGRPTTSPLQSRSLNLSTLRKDTAVTEVKSNERTKETAPVVPAKLSPNERILAVSISVEDPQGIRSTTSKIKGQELGNGGRSARFVVTQMPRSEYLKYFARNDNGEYIGTEPYRPWTAEQLDEVFGKYLDMIPKTPLKFKSRKSSREESKGNVIVFKGRKEHVTSKNGDCKAFYERRDSAISAGYESTCSWDLKGVPGGKEERVAPTKIPL